jgi:tRNA (cmo5U34)-methyltransferase
MNVGRSFDATANIYDRSRRQLIPCFDDFYAAALSLAEFPRDMELSVVDLGAGTGLMTSFFADVLPAARFTLMDIAGEMLDHARGRLADSGDRFTFVTEDFSTVEPPSGVDLVISGLAIHHLDDEAKQVLFTRIYEALNSGGIFVNADQVLGRTAAVTERNRRTWLAGARRLGVTDDDLAAAIERMKHDRMSTLEDQLRWLESAGFHDVDCAYKSGMFAVVSGRRED